MVRLWPVVVLPDGASPSARAGRKWLVAAQDPLKATLWDPGALPRAQWDPVPAVEPPVPPHQLQTLSAFPAPQVCQSKGKHWTDWFMGWEKEGCAPQSPVESWYPGLFIRHSSTRHEATWHVRSLKLWLYHSCISGTQTHVGLVGEMPQFWYELVNICLAVLFLVAAIWSHRNVTHSARNRNRVYNKVTKLLQHFQLSENFFWKLRGRSLIWGEKFS